MEPIVDCLNSAAEWTLRNSLHASVLIVGVLILVRLSGTRIAPGLRAGLWVIVGVRLLLPFAPASALSAFNLMPAAAKRAHTLAAGGPAPAETLTSSARAWGAGESDIDSGTSRSSLSPRASVSPHLFLSLVWLTGVLAILGSTIVQQIRTTRRMRRLPEVSNPELRALLATCARTARVPLTLKFVEAPRGSGVAVFGFLRVTRLVIPSDLSDLYSEREIRGIFLHELEHVRRGDLLWNWAALVVQALHWFNPLVWLAGRRFLAEREVICDRAALDRLLPGETRREYGATLIKAIEIGRNPAPTPALAPFISRKYELKHRLTMIAKSHRQNLLTQGCVASLAAAICLVTFTSATADDESKRREGEGKTRETKREGPRDGDGERESGGRESRREGPRDGDGERAPMREGELKVSIFKNGVVIGDQKIALANLRSTLDRFNASSAVVTAQPDVPFQSVATVMNALKDSGIRDVRISTGEFEAQSTRRENPRDGDSAKEKGPRDGDQGGARREGPRDGDGAKEKGPRDGDQDGGRREGPRDGDN